MTWELASRLLGAFSVGLAIASIIWKAWYTSIITKAQEVIKAQEELVEAKNELIIQLEMNLGALRFAMRTGMLVKAKEINDE